MQYKKIISPTITIVQIILAIVVLMIMTVFIARPTDSIMFTNALITILIIVQLFTINILIDVYKKVGGRKK